MATKGKKFGNREKGEKRQGERGWGLGRRGKMIGNWGEEGKIMRNGEKMRHDEEWEEGAIKQGMERKGEMIGTE